MFYDFIHMVGSGSIQFDRIQIGPKGSDLSGSGSGSATLVGGLTTRLWNWIHMDPHSFSLLHLDLHSVCRSGSRRENKCRFMWIQIHSPG